MFSFLSQTFPSRGPGDEDVTQAGASDSSSLRPRRPVPGQYSSSNVSDNSASRDDDMSVDQHQHSSEPMSIGGMDVHANAQDDPLATPKAVNSALPAAYDTTLSSLGNALSAPSGGAPSALPAAHDTAMSSHTLGNASSALSSGALRKKRGHEVEEEARAVELGALNVSGPYGTRSKVRLLGIPETRSRRLERQESTGSESDTQIRRLSKQILRYQEEKKQWQSKWDAVEEERNSLKETIEQGARASNDQLAILKNEVEMLKQALAAHEAQQSVVSKIQPTEVLIDVESCRREAAEARAEKDELERRLSDLVRQQQIESKTTQEALLSTQVERDIAKEEVEKATADIQKLRRELETKHDDYKQDLEGARCEKEELGQRLKGLEGAMENVTAALETTVKERDAATHQLSRAQATRDIVIPYLRQSRITIEETEEEDGQAIINEYLQRAANALSQVLELEEQLSALNAENQVQTKIATDLEHVKNEAQEAETTKQSTQKELEGLRQKFQNELGASQCQIKSLEKDQAEARKVSDTQLKAEQHGKQKLVEQLRHMEGEAKDAQSRECELVKRLNAAMKQVVETRKTNEELEQQLKETKETKEKYYSDIQTILNERDRALAQVRAAETTLASGEASHEAGKRTFEHEIGRLNDLTEHQRAELQDAHEALRSLSTKSDQKVASLEEKLAQLTRQCAIYEEAAHRQTERSQAEAVHQTASDCPERTDEMLEEGESVAGCGRTLGEGMDVDDDESSSAVRGDNQVSTKAALALLRKRMGQKGKKRRWGPSSDPEDIAPPMVFTRPAGADGPLSKRIYMPNIPDQSNGATTNLDNRGAHRASQSQPVASNSKHASSPASSSSQTSGGPTAGPSSSSSSHQQASRGSYSDNSQNAPDHPGDGPSTPRSSSETADVHQREMLTLLRSLDGRIARLEENQIQLPSPSPSPKKGKGKAIGDFRGQHVRKPRDSHVTMVQNLVLRELRAMLEIEVDADIINSLSKHMACPQEIQDYEDNSSRPTLEPFKPFWDFLDHAWNQALSDLFTEKLLAENDDWLGEDDADTIQKHFFQRLLSIKKTAGQYCPQHDDETEDRIMARVHEKRIQRNTAKRRRNRQKELHNMRMNICRAGAQGTAGDSAWSILLRVATLLGIEGTSSDESDGDEDGRIVHARTWISREVQELLEFIDSNKKTTNELGNRLPGARGARRIRRITHPLLSNRAALANLPRNFYDPGFLANLPPEALRQLNPTTPIPLPRVVSR